MNELHPNTESNNGPVSAETSQTDNRKSLLEGTYTCTALNQLVTPNRSLDEQEREMQTMRNQLVQVEAAWSKRVEDPNTKNIRSSEGNLCMY